MKPVLHLLAAAAITALAACSTTPAVNPDLAAARSAVEQARSNPYVAKAGAVEADRAQQALALADKAWADHHDNDETRHLAYLAQRRAEVALAVGDQAQAEERLQQAGAERDRARLEARTREADSANRVARNAQATAQNAQASAQNAQANARTAQATAQTALGQVDAARQQAAQESERAAALERDLQTLRGRSTQRGMVVTLGDVLFATGKATLQPGARHSVDRLAAVLKQYPERRVLIEGFTDSQGSEEMNMKLSQNRAEAFRDALLQNGIDGQRIEVRAHGETLPVADNATAAGRQQNRRVEVVFSDGQGRFAQN